MGRIRWSMVRASATAKAQGSLARRLGLARSHCPHPPTRATLREAWMEGYNEEDREIELRKHFAALETKNGK